MDALADPLVETVVMMTAVQVGKTEVILNAVGYYADQDPSAMLVVQPTVELAQAFSKERLAPTIEATPVLKQKMAEQKSRNADNTIALKQFPGGSLALVGANSPSGLAGRPRRIVLMDEVDRYPPSAGTEGDPVSIARKRTTNYWNRKIVLTSSPTLKGFSRIEAAYNESDRRRYFVRCFACEAPQVLLWANLHWEAGEPDSAHMICEACGARFEESDKGRLLDSGAWIAEYPGRKTAGFHLNALNSPWARWSDLVHEWADAQGIPERLRVFVNTVLAETWQEDAERVEPAGLMARRETYVSEVPAFCGMLTAGVDVQADRVELLVRGWGAGEESALVHLETVRGDPSRAEVWADVERILTRTWDGLPIAAACIDSGYLTDAVYRFVAPRQRRRVYATKGQSQAGTPIVGKFQKPNRAGVRLLPVGADSGKDLLFLRLKIQHPGPGCYHWPMWADEDYFGQLTAEQALTKYRHGRPYRVYEKEASRRNEALDMEILAYAALLTLGPTIIRSLGDLAAKRQPAAVTPTGPDPTPAQQAVRRILRPPRPGNWVNRF